MYGYQPRGQIWIYPKIRDELSGIRESKEGNSILRVSRVNVYGEIRNNRETTSHRSISSDRNKFLLHEESNIEYFQIRERFLLLIDSLDN